MKKLHIMLILLSVLILSSDLLLANRANITQARAEVQRAEILQERAQRYVRQNRSNRELSRIFRRGQSRLSAAKSYIQARRAQTAYDYAKRAQNEFNQVIQRATRRSGSSGDSSGSDTSRDPRYFADYHIKLAERYKRQATSYIRNSRRSADNRRWGYLYHGADGKLRNAKSYFSRRDYRNARRMAELAERDFKRYLGRMGARVR